MGGGVGEVGGVFGGGIMRCGCVGFVGFSLLEFVICEYKEFPNFEGQVRVGDLIPKGCWRRVV